MWRLDNVGKVSEEWGFYEYSIYLLPLALLLALLIYLQNGAKNSYPFSFIWGNHMALRRYKCITIAIKFSINTELEI